jgi:hypothetical protein
VAVVGKQRRHPRASAPVFCEGHFYPLLQRSARRAHLPILQRSGENVQAAELDPKKRMPPLRAALAS